MASITQFLRQNRWKVAVTLVAVILFSSCLLPIGILTKEMIDDHIPNGNEQLLWLNMGSILLLILIHLFGIILTRNFSARFIKEHMHHLRVRLCENVLTLSRKETEQNDISETQVRIVSYIERIDIMFGTLILTFIPALVMIAGLMLILFVINLRLATLVSVTAPMLGLILFFTKRTGTSRIKSYHEAYESFNRSVLGILRGIFLIQDEVLEKPSLIRLKTDAEVLRDAGYRVGRFHHTSQYIQEALISIVGLAVLVAGGLLIFEEQMTLGELLGFYFVVFIIRRYFNELIRSIPSLQDGLVSFQHIADHMAPAISTGETLQREEEIKIIGLQKVDFWYQPEKVILNQIDIQFEKGKIYLISGENGSGKTSLFQLLTLHYAPNKGDVLINKCHRDEIDLSHVRLKMGILPQDPVFFDFSIKENILLGRKVEQGVFDRAVRFANVDRFIEDLPKRYDTPMGDSGVFLSGGQKQKVALARTLVKEPDFLLLDEPTNHLDRQSIDHLIAEFRNLSDPPGIILISHDKSIGSVADRTFEIANSGISPKANT